MTVKLRKLLINGWILSLVVSLNAALNRGYLYANELQSSLFFILKR